MKTDVPSVALIFGGRGFEHDVSVRGAEYVFPLIDVPGYRKIPVFIKKDGAWVIPALRDLPCCPIALADGAIPTEPCFPAFGSPVGGLQTATSFLPTVCAFPLLHGDFGEDGVIQGALENANVPYVGCNTLTSAVTRDKCYVKLIAKQLGIPTAKWVYITEICKKSIEEAEQLLEYPMFVKPARLGSSVGAGVARCREELIRVLERAMSLGSGRALIEELIDVEKELECGYFGTKSEELFTNIGEISCNSSFYDYETKYFSDAAKVSPRADLTDAEVATIHGYSSRLARYLGLRGLSRIDFFRTMDGKIYFNEINTMPGFTESSLYARLVSESGISPKKLVNRLIADAGNI